jgi:hypothetical protein
MNAGRNAIGCSICLQPSPTVEGLFKYYTVYYSVVAGRQCISWLTNPRWLCKIGQKKEEMEKTAW